MRIDYAARARALVGTPFRAQRRGEGGLDCVGVILATFGIPAHAVRRDYSLRGNHGQEICGELERHFRRVAQKQLRPGDAMLFQADPQQLHLAVRTAGGFVHADACLKRVVETPGEPAWPTIGIYRKRSR